MSTIIKRLWEKIFRVAGLRRARAESRRKQAEFEAAEYLRLLEEENQELKAKLAEQDRVTSALLEEADAERKSNQAEIEDLRGRLHHERQRNRALVEKSGGPQEVAIPGELDGLKAWAEQHLAGSVVLHSRALRGAKDAQYEDVALIYQSLLLLRDDYVPMRREGGKNRKRDFKKRCQELGVELQRTGRRLRLKEQNSEYCIDVGGKPRWMDLHLKKGASRDPRECFRLYFLWDAETQVVVVGWLPSHLKTRAS